jgi:hypothetical protein
MKQCKLFFIVLGLIILIVSGCNLNNNEVTENGIVVEVGEGMPADIEDIVRTPGASWAGWYNACMSWTGIYNVYVYPYYDSSLGYAVINYMYDDDYNFVYWIRCYGAASAIPYDGFSFQYSYGGDYFDVDYYIYNNQKYVKFTNQQGQWTKYTKQ